MENEYLQPTVAPSPTFEMIQGYQNPAYANNLDFPLADLVDFVDFLSGDLAFRSEGSPLADFLSGGSHLEDFPLAVFRLAEGSSKQETTSSRTRGKKLRIELQREVNADNRSLSNYIVKKLMESPTPKGVGLFILYRHPFLPNIS
jgi:hypothetical protein